ncbi:MAG TPA: hypothetical protein ENG73_08995 [Desulfobacterales bacterium]|nr:hypothetical protein [Desulfobacterales bacterium]
MRKDTFGQRHQSRHVPKSNHAKKPRHNSKDGPPTKTWLKQGLEMLALLDILEAANREKQFSH